MKTTLLFLSCLCASAQVPIQMSIPKSVAFSGLGTTTLTCSQYDYTGFGSGTLFLELFSCSGTTNSNNAILQRWTDLSSSHNDFTNAANSSISPTYLVGQTPNLQPAVYFGGSGVHYLDCTNDMGKSQSITWFVVAYHQTGTLSTETLFDIKSGNRELFQIGPGGGSPFWYAGGSLVATPHDTHIDNTWLVWTIQFSGASSQVWTNNVSWLTGSPGTSGMGDMRLGADNTLVSAFQGYVTAVIGYSTAVSSGDRAAIVSSLRTQFGF